MQHGVRKLIAGLFAALATACLLRRALAGGDRGRLEGDRGRLGSRRVGVGGLNIHAQVSLGPVPRERSPVALVHGLGMSSRYMVPLAKHLAPDFRVYAPDLPGFGASDVPPRILTTPELADALAGFMDAVGLRRATFI